METPTAVAAVRGTIFSVEVKNGKTEVAVFKGKVKVSSDGEDHHEENIITPGVAAVSTAPGELQKQNGASLAGEFKKQGSIVQPALDASVKKMEDGDLLVTGNTEAGNDLTINGKNVRVLGNGTFRYRTPAKSAASFTVVSTDKHGESATKVVKPVL